MATGGGKTLFALSCLESVQKLIPHIQFTVIVPTVLLADQWHVNLREDLGANESQISHLGASATAVNVNDYNICVINSARQISEATWSIRPRFLVVDECHRAGSAINALALRGATAATLGLSATPARQYDRGFEDLVAPKLGSVIYDYSLESGLADGVLTPFTLVNVRVPMTVSEQIEYDKSSARVARLMDGRELSGEALRIALMRRARISNAAIFRVPTAARILDRYRGHRTLVFHESTSRADELMDILKRRSHSVTRYHSKISSAMRRENLRLFRRGVYDTLVACRALDEGTNIPETEVAVIAAATASERQRIQRLGRVLRPSPGKKSALVYTIYASKAEEERLVAEASRYLGLAEVQWQSVEGPPT